MTAGLRIAAGPGRDFLRIRAEVFAKETKMRYEIEKTRLSDHASGAGRITFHHFEGSDIDEAVTRFIEIDDAELISDVVTFGSEGVVTTKKGDDLFVLRLYPSVSEDGKSSNVRLQYGIS